MERKKGRLKKKITAVESFVAVSGRGASAFVFCEALTSDKINEESSVRIARSREDAFRLSCFLLGSQRRVCHVSIVRYAVVKAFIAI